MKYPLNYKTTEKDFQNLKSNDYVFAECLACSLEFKMQKKKVVQTLKEKSKYRLTCNKTCQSKVDLIKTNCFSCNKETFKTKKEVTDSLTKRLFCSKSCSASFNNTLRIKSKKYSYLYNECSCGKPKTKKAEYCKECFKIEAGKPILEKTLRELTASSDTSIRFNAVRAHARKFMKQSNIVKECIKCKTNEFKDILEVCHIKALKDFSEETLIKEVNSLNNLIYLCPSHHTLLDKGLITI